jgi:hypothetical protein
MQPRQLKTLIDTGHYQPQPELVAEAMLRRRGVRQLLGAEGPLSQAGRIPPPSTARRQAA